MYHRRRKAGKNEYVSAYNLVSHSRERELLRERTDRCAGETMLKRVPLGSGQPYHVPVSRAVPPLPSAVRYPEEDRPLSGDRTSASQTQASRLFHPSLPGFSFQLTVPPRVFLEYTHVPRKRKRTNESVAPLKPTCRCVRASQRQLRFAPGSNLGEFVRTVLAPRRATSHRADGNPPRRIRTCLSSRLRFVISSIVSHDHATDRDRGLKNLSTKNSRPSRVIGTSRKECTVNSRMTRIPNCDFLSHNAINSPVCTREIYFAFRHGFRFFPLRKQTFTLTCCLHVRNEIDSLKK